MVGIQKGEKRGGEGDGTYRQSEKTFLTEFSDETKRSGLVLLK